MSKELFPLKTTQPDAIVERLNELQELINGITSGSVPLGNITVDALDVKYGSVFRSVLNVKGDLSTEGSLYNFENLVDQQGNHRFCEGDIELYEDETIITKTYGKWSLSGTHLMIVLAGNIPNASVGTGRTICDVNIPEWIFNKIVPIDNAGYVAVNAITTYNADHTSTQTIRFDLVKQTTKLCIGIGSVTATDDRYFRVGFDLLIDNEQPQPEP